jgi:hypothetical protein
LPNAQGQTYEFDAAGSFAVEITLGTCKDTSDCFVIAGLNSPGAVNNIRVYPNPANEWIDFQQLQGTSQLKMFDVNGRLLKNETIFQGVKMDISDLAPGLYLIQLETSASQLVHAKLIVH